jgi:hypothetical protein
MIVRFIHRLLRQAPALAAGLALATGVLTAAAPARADLRIVQEHTITGLEESNFYSVPRQVTYYWKGDKYREDLPGGDIYYIYDCAKDRYYIVNNRDRTYTIMTLNDALTQRKGIIKNMKVEGRATVEPGGSSKTISGQKAKNYTLSMDVRLKLETSGQTIAVVKMEGEQWITTGKTGVDARCQKIIQAAYARGIFRYNKILEPLYAKLSGLNGVPLNYDMILNIAAPALAEGGLDGGTIEAHAMVKSVSVKPLPASLFAVPSSYQLVEKMNIDDTGDGLQGRR